MQELKTTIPKTSRAHSKPQVNEPGDSYEQQADAMADRVIKRIGGDGKGTVKPPVSGLIGMSVQRKCAQCEEEDKNKVMRKENGAGRVSVSSSFASSLQSTIGAGSALPKATRNLMENAFGADFSGVRIHTGDKPSALSKSINSKAFTYGNDIYFKSGEYSPNSEKGQWLLAHELTHTIQQNGAIARKIQRAVDHVEINCGDNQIRFEHDGQLSSYNLDHCDVTDGTYNATVSLSEAQVRFSLVGAPVSTHFGFDYSIGPNQANPNTFFSGQRTVSITCTHLPSIEGSSVFNVSFESYPLGHLLASAGSTSRLVAMGNLSWLTAGGRMQWGTLLGGTTWNPMFNLFPGADRMLLDRIIDIGDGSTRATSDLMLALEPRLQAQLRSGGPFSWTSRGFSPEQLASLEELVRRMNMEGIASLNEAELALLRRAAYLHIDGASAGSSFVSYTPIGETAPFLEHHPTGSDVRYRVRVRVNSASVLDGITPSEFNAPNPEMYSNPLEFEMLVTTNAEGELLSVQRVAEGAEPPGWIMRNSRVVRWGGRILLLGGAALSYHHITSASEAERPRVIAQEAGSWGGGYVGTELGAGACVALGIATEGLGLLACGLIGGIGGGIVGSHAPTVVYDAFQTGIDIVSPPIEDFHLWMDRGIRDIYGINSMPF